MNNTMGRTIERTMLYMLCEILENNTDIILENLKTLTSSLVNVRRFVGDICSWGLLHSIYYPLNNNCNSIKIEDGDKTVIIYMKERQIEIINYVERKRVKIKLDEELSDELFDWLTDFYHNESIKLNLENINEKIIEREYDIDISGLH